MTVPNCHAQDAALRDGRRERETMNHEDLAERCAVMRKRVELSCGGLLEISSAGGLAISSQEDCKSEAGKWDCADSLNKHRGTSDPSNGIRFPGWHGERTTHPQATPERPIRPFGYPSAIWLCVASPLDQGGEDSALNAFIFSWLGTVSHSLLVDDEVDN